MRRQIERCRPYPELLTRSSWDVRHVPNIGMTELRERKMFVPLSARPEAKGIRQHELAHVKWTPKGKRFPRDIENSTIQQCEDARIQILWQRRMGSMLGAISEKECQELLFFYEEEGRFKEELLAALCTVGTTLYDPHGILRQSKYPSLEHIFSSVVDDLRKQPTWEKMLHCARWIDAIFSGLEEPDFKEKEKQRKRLSKLFSKGDYVSVDETVDWGELSIEELPLSLRFRGGGRKYRNLQEGGQLRNLHRLHVDGSIFRRKKKFKGGTVLVDGSGSMCLSQEEIFSIIEAAPAATVAIYSGSGRQGTLAIVAKSGKMVNETPPREGGNVVDGPALRWLGMQEEPHIWISDGEVTGMYDHQTSKLINESIKLCSQHRVTRVEDVEKAKEAICVRRIV
jgi:hypothetical protein